MKSSKMFYRLATALLLASVAAGACSGSQNEGVSLGTTVATTTDTAVSTTAEFVLPSAVATAPATTIPVVATPPVVEIVSPSTTSTTHVLDLSYLGHPVTVPSSTFLPLPAWDFVEIMQGDWGEVEISGSVLELIEDANVACEAAVERPEVSECGEAVLLACDVGIAEVESSADSGIMSEDVVKHICHAAVVAESGELGYVLSERYSDMSVSKHLYFVGNRGGYESFRNQIRDEISELFDSLFGWEISVATREVLLGLSRNVSDFARPFSEPTRFIY